MRRTHSDSEIRDIAEDVSDAGDQELAARIDDLEAKVRSLEGDINGVRALGLENAANADSLRETVSYNAKAARERILAEETARGRCGSRLVQVNSGTLRNELIPCTEKDLWPNR